MTVEDAEKNVGCLVEVAGRDYTFGGKVFMLCGAWREVSRSGCRDYGIEMKICGDDKTVYTAAASAVELIPYQYPRMKYKIEQSEISPKDIPALLGSEVEYCGQKVMLKRLYKLASDEHIISYAVDVQDITAPYVIRRCKISEISRLDA